MFEKAVLDNLPHRRSKWSWVGVLIQFALVTAMLLVPMVSPELLTIMMPKSQIFVPAKPVAPVEVEVTAASGAQSSAVNTAAPRRPVRPFTAPSTYSNPVNTIIDPAGFAPPAFTIGAPVSSAYTGPISGIGLTPSAPAPKPAEPPKPEPAKPIRVGGQVQMANILHRVNPAYPPLAKQARISGLVKLEGIIAKDGTVQQLQVISGHPLLVPAALAAVRQWRYRPTLLNGQPVEVIAPIDINFILSN